MKALRVGSAGAAVRQLQRRLKALGFNPGNIDGRFGPATEAAVLAFQRSEGLPADGVVGPRTAAALKLGVTVEYRPVIPHVTVGLVSRMFPATPLDNIKRHLPPVLTALSEAELTGKRMVLAALSTIRAETAAFVPVSENQSRFNTSPGGHPFDLYDYRKDLGNQGPPDGERYRGRGFVQLTGRYNYATFGAAVGLGDELLSNPELANEPEIAARLLAAFLKAREIPLEQALLEGDLRAARRLVNGATHGLEEFVAAYRIGDSLLPDELS
ncbi:MAG: peptidoglycan-binding protein [Bryobacteraceae bacterium]|nr:peptidoglycan-binding protein [Bryobacteraceae bacterium]